MTTFQPETRQCALCGAAVECLILTSTNAFGSRDLDMRPPGMMRSTMHTWLQECPECGYVAADVSQEAGDAGKLVESDAYRAAAADESLPALARRFVRHAMLTGHDDEACGMTLLRAAWCCDDAGNTERAASLRSQAADRMLALQPYADSDQDVGLGAIVVDMLRRASRFDDAVDLIAELLPRKPVEANEFLRKALRFQESLCAKRDTGRYTVSDAQGVDGQRP